VEYAKWVNKIHCGDVLEILRQMPDEFVDCIITSPPYWGLRDYGVKGQIGLEPTLEEYLEKMLAVTGELKRVLKQTGVMFWNHGDCYGGSGCGRNDYRNNNKRSLSNPMLYCNKPNPQVSLTPKCMALQNYRLILRMIDEQGWILRNIIIWHKPNHMPSSVKDRLTNAYEPVFLLTKSKYYYFDLDAVRVPHKEIRSPKIRKDKGKIIEVKEAGDMRNVLPYARTGIEYQNPLGKNPGDVWTIPIQPFPEAHFATFPERLVEPMIKVGCPQWICKKCGKARVRITETFGFTKGAVAQSKHYTIGWTDCGCNAGWRPGIVLDPFIGSGTIAKVAARLRRQWIGIELNPQYVEMAYKRLRETQLEMFV